MAAVPIEKNIIAKFFASSSSQLSFSFSPFNSYLLRRLRVRHRETVSHVHGPVGSEAPQQRPNHPVRASICRPAAVGVSDREKDCGVDADRGRRGASRRREGQGLRCCR